MFQLYCDINFSYVKESKEWAISLKEQKVALDETLVWYDVSALFTSIPVSVALEIIEREFTEHINQKGLNILWKYLLHTQRQSYLSCN